jgi:hypothetical protein
VEDGVIINRRTLTKILFASSLTLMAVSAEAGEEALLTQSIEALRKAMLAKDKGEFEKLCADELTYGHSSGKTENKAEFITGAISPKWHWKSLEFVPATMKVVGDIGIARVTMNGVYEVEGGKVSSINDSVLMVWRWQEGQWKLLARQAYKT